MAVVASTAAVAMAVEVSAAGPRQDISGEGLQVAREEFPVPRGVFRRRHIVDTARTEQDAASQGILARAEPAPGRPQRDERARRTGQGTLAAPRTRTQGWDRTRQLVRMETGTRLEIAAPQCRTTQGLLRVPVCRAPLGERTSER